MIQPKIIYTKCNQNTPLPAFSVTDYDDLGRIEAVFEYCTSETIDLENAKDPHELAGFLDDPNSIKREYFRTFYDESPFLPQASDFWPENLQNRVACQAYYEEDPNPNSFDEPDAAYHYSYDIHGNVKTLLQQDTDMADYKWEEIITEYEYEIGSGNVLLVKYQEGKNDRMYHKYFYDADNRIIEVQTSNTQANKGLRTEAEYFYYPHGPLARVELGDKNRKVQGMDYIYTINGWIKAVNASTIDTTRDAGKDGKRKLPLGGVNPHRSIAADAFAYSLHYFENDYTPAVPNQGLIISFNGSGLQEAIKGSGLYNGNITAQVIALRKPEDNSPKIPLAGYAYQYDRLNRLKHMNSSVDFNGEADSGNSWNNIAINSYRSNYSYDANGNITRLDRFDIDSVLIDSLLYHYNTNNNGRIINNRLDYITQSVSTNPNLSDQNSNNYEYDEIGNLISDAIHEISNIEWNSFGKVKMVEFNSKLPLWFRYDSYGRRVMKYDQSLDRATFYTYDASGNVMGIYERKFDGQHDALYISQLPMYGSSRLGVINSNTKLSFDNGNGIVVCDNLHDDDDLNIKYVYCDRQYELTNHLGNVMTTISDDRMGVADNSSFPSTVLYYLPKILTTTDYYPFGMQMPDRSYVATGSGYRFGFNNMEKDDELKGPGNSYDFGARLYDPRVGRWLSVDPLQEKLPSWSSYNFCFNSPILYKDPDGKYPYIVITNEKTGYTISKSYSYNGRSIAVAVPTYKMIVYDVNEQGQKTVMGVFNVTRDGWYKIGESSNNNHLVNYTTEPASASDEIVNAEENYTAGWGSPTLVFQFEWIRAKERPTEIDMNGNPISTQVKRDNPNIAKSVQIHVGGLYEAVNGNISIGGTYGCFGLVDNSQIFRSIEDANRYLGVAQDIINGKTLNFDVTKFIKPSNEAMNIFNTSINRAINNARNRGETNAADSKGRIIRRDNYEKRKEVSN